MTHKCCVRDCEEAVRETRSRGLPLHKFPKDALMRQRWLVSGGFDPEFRPTASQIVCYKHFRQSDYEVGRSHKLFLKKGSVPSIFRDYENHPDPIGPTSAFITNRLLAREAAAIAAREAANNSSFIKVVEVADSSGCLESSCSSLEASMDSSNSLQMVDGGDVKESIDSPNKSLSASDSEMVKVAVIAQETNMEEKKDESKRVPNRADINFMPGTKLEAKDFNEKWYSAKVVEVDWIEREVLIHFDKWSSRFDEWIPMDSSRLRTSQIPGVSQEGVKTRDFVAGERILATWVDGKKYPAKVNGILGSDKYDVLFDDGYSKILKSSKMTRLAEVGLIGMIKPPGQEDGAAVASTYVGSKQERRDKKRKHTITELFQHKKKVKHEGEKVPRKQEPQVKFAPKVEAVSTVVRAEPVVSEVYHYPESTGKLEGIKKNIFKTYGNDLLRGTDEKSKGHVAGADEDYTTFIGNLRVEIEDSTYKCPKTGCNKNFRKENLLQMHIKHYHPEYSKFLGSTPNVADLAYARTIGESVEDLIPKKIRVPTTPTAPIVHAIHTTPPPVPHIIETDYKQSDVDSSFENKLSVENNMSATEDNSSEHNSCTLSPGRLFDMRSKEEKLHTGIKTLPPVRPPVVQPPPVEEPVQPVNIPIEIQKPSTSNDKIKVHRKRQQQYQVEPTVKTKKHRATLEPDESYENLDNNLQETDDTPDLNYKCNNTSNNKVEVDSNVETTQNKNEGVQLINGELIKVEKLRREEIINCTCGIIEEDGLMIQCDLCLCWQHGHCNNIEIETDVPEKYICFTCQNSHRQRPSKKYIHDQEWIREGKLPSMCSFPEDPAVANKRTAMLKRSYDLIASILQIQDLLHSLRVKVNVAQNKDHPKLYLWAKNWNKVKIPTFTPEPVPIMQVVKSENVMDGITDENTKEILDFNFSIKNDPDQKLITSDTELMKILEEDPIQPEEIKPVSKNFKDEGRILLDALTRNGGFDDQEALKAEINGDLLSKKSPAKSPVKPTATLTQPIVPEPEAPIDPVECKLRLLEHIDHFQNYVDSVLNYVEVQVAALEGLDENVAATKPDHDEHTQTKQTIQMLLHDLETIRKLASLC